MGSGLCHSLQNAAGSIISIHLGAGLGIAILGREEASCLKAAFLIVCLGFLEGG